MTQAPLPNSERASDPAGPERVGNTQAAEPASPSERLARRYGASAPRTSRGKATWIGSAAVAVIIAAVAIWLALLDTPPVAAAEAMTYEVVDDHTVIVEVAVRRPDPSVPVTCTIEALDASLAQVGARTFEVPASQAGTKVLEVELTTLARAEQARAPEGGCY